MFNAARFLDDNFGTPDAVLGMAAKYKIEVPARDTVRKWFSREAISGEWLPVLLAMLEFENGSAISLKSYLDNDGDYHGVFG